MRTIGFENVELTGGFLAEKQRLNREVTLQAVYDRFCETGRFGALDCGYREGGSQPRPHHFWDSDVAKWLEGAAYALQKQRDPALEARVDAAIESLCAHQWEDGYINSYYTACCPKERFTDRDMHELYCAGHLMEAAVAYAQATGKKRLLEAVERYASLIERVFVTEKSAAFATPGHEELELALVRLYRYTGKDRYLRLAAHFINARGAVEEPQADAYNQSHLPVRQQTEAVGHAVRACYLYTGMAYLAAETGDEALTAACRRLYDDVTGCKMYVTGGTGSTHVGEAFTARYDLPNAQAYSETCAGIALMLFANGMLALENDARYADTVERALYNVVLSGLSQSGDAFFYENPLEIHRSEHFRNRFGAYRFPIMQRVRCFDCSCCPPNLNRLLASLGNYAFGLQGDTLYLNQFMACRLQTDAVCCTVQTDYPRSGVVRIQAQGVSRVAVRIPGWCRGYTINHPAVVQNGYALVENDGGVIELTMDMTPYALYADSRVSQDVGRLCICRGPVVYCAEEADNGEDLNRFAVPENFTCTQTPGAFGLPELEVACLRRQPFAAGQLYAAAPPQLQSAVLHMVPYHAFANRGESDMLVWLPAAPVQ